MYSGAALEALMPKALMAASSLGWSNTQLWAMLCLGMRPILESWIRSVSLGAAEMLVTLNCMASLAVIAMVRIPSSLAGGALFSLAASLLQAPMRSAMLAMSEVMVIRFMNSENSRFAGAIP